jgi:hypothetical protein
MRMRMMCKLDLLGIWDGGEIELDFAFWRWMSIAPPAQSSLFPPLRLNQGETNETVSLIHLLTKVPPPPMTRSGKRKRSKECCCCWVSASPLEASAYSQPYTEILFLLHKRESSLSPQET